MITKTQIFLFLKLPIPIKKRVKINKETGCWEWQGQLNRNGYGRFYCEGKRPMAHKFVWALLGRGIPEGYVLDHHCRKRCCVNPTHISDVTVKINTHRGRAKLFKRRSK